MKKKKIADEIYVIGSEMEYLESKFSLPVFEDVSIQVNRALEDIRSHLSMLHSSVTKLHDEVIQ